MVKIRGFDGLIFQPHLYEHLLTKNMEYMEDCQLIKNFNTQQFVTKGLLQSEKQQFLYLYEQQFLGLVTLGLLAELSLIDYHQRKIKKHEKTLVRPHLNEYTYAKDHVGPVIVGHEHCQKIDSILHDLKNSLQPLSAWQTVDGRKHKLWRICSSQNIISSFDALESFYILDGHHRFEAASAYLQQLGQNAKQKNKWVQGLVYSKKYIRAFPQFRKLIHKDCNSIIRQLMQNKKLHIQQIKEYDPHENNEELVLLDQGKFYQIMLEDPIEQNSGKSGVQNLDIILKQAFQSAEKVSHNPIKFVPSIMFNWNNVANESHPIFLVKSPSISTIFSKADQNQILPPKSTWLEPKPCLHMVIRVPY